MMDREGRFPRLPHIFKHIYVQNNDS